MPRLIQLAAYPNSHPGSFIPFLAAVLTAAGSRGWDVAAMLPPQAAARAWIGDLEATGAELLFIEPTRQGPACGLRRRLAARTDSTVLHSHFTRYDIAAATAAWRRSDVAAYWHVHTVLSDRPRVRLSNQVKFTTLGRAVEGIFTPAPDVAADLVRRGAPAAKVTVFPNAIDTSRFALPDPAARVRARCRLGLPPEAEVLLHFGRDWQLKGGDLFLDTVARLAAAGRPVHALINQGGEAARSAAEARGLGSRVTDVALVEDPRELFQAADALVSSSTGETMPYVVTEALSSGIPVVAGELAGHRFVAERVEDCAIVARDPEAMAVALARFLERDATESGRAAIAAHRWVGENLDVRDSARRLLERYEADLTQAGSAAD